MDRIKLSLYAYMAGGGCMVKMFCEKPIFPTAKEYILFNYHGGC